MPNYLNLLKQKYDKEVRENCDKFLNSLNLCLEEDHFYDNFICEPYQTSFNNCIKNFNENFKKKYEKNTRIHFIYD